VADTFREGQCPAEGVAVHYDPLFRRDTSDIPTNTVPAFVAGTDGTLGFGTALGFTRFQDGQFTPVPFQRGISLRGDAATLEAFFQEVAAAIFASRPLTAVAIGAVSFVESFGGPVIKEDLIFSAVEESPERVWLGTLGGGLRRLEGEEDTLLLTRQEGLSSNVILALAVGPDGTLWAATDEGVSRVQEVHGQVIITNFSALDGLALPVRDVAVDAEGAAWLATDGGLFRIGSQGVQVQGMIQDTTGRPVMGADVGVPGTPFQTVTDAAGQFVLANLPPGLPQLRVDGQLAMGGPFTSACADLRAPGRGQNLGGTAGEQRVEPVALVPLAVSGSLNLVRISENGQTGRVGSQIPLEVAVVDAQGNPVAGLPVTFTVLNGPGRILPACVSTDPTGQAATTLTVTEAGAIRVEASVAGGRFSSLQQEGAMRGWHACASWPGIIRLAHQAPSCPSR
jgi:hypothetical protein